jgi:hypothetical protein
MRELCAAEASTWLQRPACDSVPPSEPPPICFIALISWSLWDHISRRSAYWLTQTGLCRDATGVVVA